MKEDIFTPVSRNYFSLFCYYSSSFFLLGLSSFPRKRAEWVDVSPFSKSSLPPYSAVYDLLFLSSSVSFFFFPF